MSDTTAAEAQEHHLIHSRLARLLLKELPYLAVLLLTIYGVASTSVSSQPLTRYWEFLALAMGILCITTGWLHAHTREARLRVLWTQTLHWLAFQVAMYIVLLPSVHVMMTAPATGLALLMLLALGTFVAGIHISWEICVLGLIMALFVPAIAWLTQNVLFLLLGLFGLFGIALAVWWSMSARATPAPRAKQEVLD